MKRAKKGESDLSEKVENLETQLKRSLADYANLQRRVEEDKKKLIEFANISLLTKFLPVIDSLEKATADIKNKGLELIGKKFREILFSEGIREIETNGYFNPSLHEAVEAVQGEEEGKILEVVQKGYMMGDKVLRAAKVKVSKSKIEQPET